MVYGTSRIQFLPASGFVSGMTGSSKISVPVSPSSYIYSQFEHISGVPAPDGTKGVSISKLKILDVLIDQLSQLKRKGDPAPENKEILSDERLDALIETYEKQLQTAYAAHAAMPYKPQPTAPTGAIFNLVA